MAEFTVGKYLAARLEQIGLKHYFMVPGDYNLVLLDELLANTNLEPATFGSASFAGEFTVREGKRYRATLALDSVERLVDNALIARKFRALGFSKVRVSGTGAMRRVDGVWLRKDATAALPRQIVAVASLR